MLNFIRVNSLCLTEKLDPCNRELFRNVIISQLIKNFRAFHRIRIFIAVCVRSSHWHLS